MAVTIVTRQTGSYAKNSTLTNTELDTNFINLKDAVDNVNVNIENTKSSIRPSLLLDFANSKRLDKRITFTRASKATRYNSDGLLEVIDSGKPRFDHDPVTEESLGLLIEEPRTNLLTYSENFAYATGVYAPMVLSQNVATAPDGSLTACKASTTNGGSFYKQVAGISGTGTYSLSIYINTKSTCTNADFSGFFIGSSTQAFGASINPSTGAVTSTSTNTSATSTSVGNGWYRYTLTGTGTNSGNTTIIWQLYSNIATTNDIIFWSAQVEAGAFATSYIPSNDTFTSRASTATYIGSDGLIKSAAINTARDNYNPVNLKLAPKLLLEPASTNLLTYSEQFDNAVWTKSNATVTANATTAPDGTVTADKLVENTATSTHYTVSLAITAAASPHTVSAFIKAGELSTVRLMFRDSTAANYIYADFNSTILTPPTVFQVGTVFSTISSTVTDVGNGWKRIAITATPSVTSVNMWLRLVKGNTDSYTGADTSGIYIWGAQLESGTTATSYIPTTASQVTRSADVSSSSQATRVADSAVMTDLKWFRPDEGTIFSIQDYNTNPLSKFIAVFDTGVASWGPRMQFSRDANSEYIILDNVNDSLVVDASVAAIGISNIAFGYKNNDYVGSGTLGTSDNVVSVPTKISRLVLGASPVNSHQLNGHLNKIAYYPKRLSNTELQSLTGG